MFSSISKLLIEYFIPTEKMAEKESSAVGVSDFLHILETVTIVIFLDIRTFLKPRIARYYLILYQLMFLDTCLVFCLC